MRSRTGSRVRGNAVLGVAFAAPATALLVLFLVVPIGVSADYSTTQSSGFGDKVSVGLDNYIAVIHDDRFWNALIRNVQFATIVVVLTTAIGFLLAYALFVGVTGSRFLQAALVVPYVVPVVVTALMWQALLEPQNGLLNSALRGLGLDALASDWLSGTSTALISVALIHVWVIVPFAMLIIFGSMLAVPVERLEAAQLDGAGHLTRMVRIVLPAVRPAVILVMVVVAVQLFRSFDLVWLLTEGGPISSTTIGTLYVYVQGFVNNDYGYANAVGLVLGILVALLAAIPFVIQRIRTRTREQRA